MNDGEFDRIALRRKPPESGAHRLAAIGILVAASPMLLGALGYALTPDTGAFSRLSGLFWGYYSAVPAALIAITIGIVAVRRGSIVGYATILAGCPALLMIPGLIEALT